MERIHGLTRLHSFTRSPAFFTLHPWLQTATLCASRKVFPVWSSTIPQSGSLLVLLLKHAEAEGVVVRVRVEIWMRTG